VVEISIAGFKKGEKRLEVEVQPGDLDMGDWDAELAGPVDLVLDLYKNDKGVVIRGRAEGVLRLECARCLEKFEQKVSFPVEAVYRFAENPVAVDPWEEGEAPREITPQTVTVDLEPDVHDGLILSIPMKPLCRPDCKGLCPVCKVNRNMVECH